MRHTCYHTVSNHSNEYVRTLEEVQAKIPELCAKGENVIKVSQVFTEEDFDTINLNEVEIPLDDININHTLATAELL
ncbi:MAG: hypothetical protein KJN64_02940 [Ignavibacteria bacterium]|nr:hypothetical protein [Ignavibacteria bacterium]MBT8384015.1 hypothetical protein [Ignavibacteria bacterium]MBT8391953.1 hypothetical protein [Ignavibacteria bacterium]NNJ52184.1 hypothetical protein [Ignavibacteriaceae bacterium]NNL21773.1 hypothetical protein [Ignavibacteriaceae bacterium]